MKKYRQQKLIASGTRPPQTPLKSVQYLHQPSPFFSTHTPTSPPGRNQALGCIGGATWSLQTSLVEGRYRSWGDTSVRASNNPKTHKQCA